GELLASDLGEDPAVELLPHRAQTHRDDGRSQDAAEDEEREQGQCPTAARSGGCHGQHQDRPSASAERSTGRDVATARRTSSTPSTRHPAISSTLTGAVTAAIPAS